MTTGPQDILAESPYADDLDQRLEERGRWRPPTLTLVLAAALLLGAGFVGGALTQRSLGGSGGATPVRSAAAPRFGGAGDVTTGTVKLVAGHYVYVRTSSGVVKIKVTDKTTVKITKSGKVSQLKPGQTVVAQGEKAADGTVTATSVSEGTGAGTSQGRGGASGRGEFPGNGRPGGGTPP